MSESAALIYWVEIEGLPYAYGTVQKTSAWFSGRAATDQFEGINAWLEALPSLPEQRLDHIEGVVSGGSMTVSIRDYDGTLTGLTAIARTTNLLRLGADVDYNDATFTVVGDTSGWASSGTAYVDFETVTYSAGVLATVVRGKYRSRAVAHDGGVLTTSTPSNAAARVSVGTAVTQYPRRLEGRRVWLYTAANTGSASAGTCLWSGVIEEVGYTGDSLRILNLTCSQSFGELRQGVCADLGTFGMEPWESGPVEFFIASRSMAPRDPNDFSPDLVTFRDSETYRFAARPTRRETVTGTPGTKRRTFLADGWQVMRLGSAFSTELASSIDVTIATSRYDYGYVTDKPFAGGAPGSTIKEVVLITDGGAQPFTAGNHPLQVLLQFLLSDQGGGVHVTTWDTLPAGFGLAMDPDRVDIDGIESLIAVTPNLKVFRVIDAPIENFGEWARTHLLKPFGFYLRPSLGNTIGIGRMTPPTPDIRANAVTIDVNSGGVQRGGIGAWGRDTEDVIGTVRVRAGEQPTPEGFKSVTEGTVQITDADGRLVVLEYPKARTVEIDIGGMSGYATAEENYRRVLDYVSQVGARFSAPVATITLTVALTHYQRNVGDFVALTHARIPSQFSATRGVSAELWEVIGRRVNLSESTVTLTLRQSNVALLETRYLAPAMLIGDISGSPTFLIDTTYFVASGQDATAAFAEGDAVRVYSSDLTRSTLRTIANIATPDVELDDGTGVSIGDVIVHADYSDWEVAASTAASALAFRAASGATLTDHVAATHNPHEFA